MYYKKFKYECTVNMNSVASWDKSMLDALICHLNQSINQSWIFIWRDFILRCIFDWNKWEIPKQESPLSKQSHLHEPIKT